MKGEALRLKGLQLALDAHDVHCGDPVRAILLHPIDYQALDWQDFRGIPIEPDPYLPEGRVRIDCLTTTVRDAIAEFHAALLQGEPELRDAEARLEAKLEQLKASLDEWWLVSRGKRDGEWWRNVARREPALYKRTLRGHTPSTIACSWSWRSSPKPGLTIALLTTLSGAGHGSMTTLPPALGILGKISRSLPSGSPRLTLNCSTPCRSSRVTPC